MRDVCIKLSQEMDRQGYTNARMALESGVSETTIRRVRAAEGSVSIETGVAIARILNLSLDEITGLMTPPAAAALAAIEDTVCEDLEEKYKPNSEHCATTCPARKAMNETIQMITAMNAEALRKEEELYERGIAQKNKQIQEQEEELKKEKAMNEARIRRWRIATVSLFIAFVAAVGFTFYLVFYDFANPHKGILQYLTVEQVLEYLDEAGHLTR